METIVCVDRTNLDGQMFASGAPTLDKASDLHSANDPNWTCSHTAAMDGHL